MTRDEIEAKIGPNALGDRRAAIAVTRDGPILPANLAEDGWWKCTVVETNDDAVRAYGLESSDPLTIPNERVVQIRRRP